MTDWTRHICWYCGAPAAHHGMCYAHSVHFNGAERAAQFQKEEDERRAQESSSEE